MSPTATLLDIIQASAAVATAVGVFIAGWQLGLSKRQAVTTFEDQLASQYRDIARRLPVEALLGETLDEASYREALPEFYHYFDLSNEQACLRSQKRIRKRTWSEWRDGIKQNVNRPAFARAWDEISCRAPESFNDLRREIPELARPAISTREVGQNALLVSISVGE